MDDGLEACPACGSPAVRATVVELLPPLRVACSNFRCDLRGPKRPTQREADEAWNSLAELARLRAEVGRLIVAWPEGGQHYEEGAAGTVYLHDTGDSGWWVNRELAHTPDSGPYPSKEAAVRAAAGLDAGDASAPPAP